MISWEALDAERELFIDPFAKLSPEQLQDLSYVRRVQWLIGESKLSAESNDAVKADRSQAAGGSYLWPSPREMVVAL